MSFVGERRRKFLGRTQGERNEEVDEEEDDYIAENNEEENVNDGGQAAHDSPLVDRRYVNLNGQATNPPIPRLRSRHVLASVSETIREADDEEEAAADDREDDEGEENEEEGQKEFRQHEQDRSYATNEPRFIVESDRLNLEHQLCLLRDLLAIERANNERRQHNNEGIQKYVQQLQADFLKQQGELVEALEFCHKLKGQKESQIACIEATLKQKDELIDRLKVQLSNLNEDKLRKEIELALEKQQELANLEQEQLRKQVTSAEQRLCAERVNNSQLLQQFQAKLDDRVGQHERELGNIQERLNETKSELDRILSEPQNLVIKSLREDNSKLGVQVDELNLSLEEIQSKYNSVRKRVENLSSEQQRLGEESQLELARLQQLNVEQRQTINTLKCELEDKDEAIQLMQFNLERSEKRVGNLLVALKEKEVAYRELIVSCEAKQEDELGRLKGCLEAAEKRLVECESELNKKQNELIKSQMEQESQLESIRNDRDERLHRASIIKMKTDKALQSAELKLARETEHSNQQAQLADKLERELAQIREEAKRLSIELTRSEAVGRSRQIELQQQQQITLDKLKELEKKLVVANESDEKFASVTRELNDEINHSKKLKSTIEILRRDNEKLCAKLQIVELNLDKTRSTVQREHEKMLRDYERKLESIKEDRVSFDRNRLRYKRYGYKLKKYCEHLKRVHQHLCSPGKCGYIIGPSNSLVSARNKSNQSTGAYSNIDYNTDLLDSDGCDDGENNLSDSAEFTGEGSDLENSIENEPVASKRPSTNENKNLQANSATKRFVIKRTGLESSNSTPKQQSTLIKPSLHFTLPSQVVQPTSQQVARVPLRTKNTNIVTTMASRSTSSCPPTNNLNFRPRQQVKDEHSYYYIRVDEGSEKSTPIKTNSASTKTPNNLKKQSQSPAIKPIIRPNPRRRLPNQQQHTQVLRARI